MKADNKVLVNDSTGAWILGSKNIQLDVKGKKELVLITKTSKPEKYTENGVITIDISAMNAVSFKARLGCDSPLGDESARRKTMAVRSHGKDARYLSVIEPYENESVIK